MKILTDSQLKEADKYTIENEPIKSIELMERASTVIAEWFVNNIEKERPLLFLIGKGNNGGDGLAVARILYHSGYDCSIVLPFDKELLTDECYKNMERLPSHIERKEIRSITPDTIVVDALLGTGIKGDVKEPLFSIIEEINSLPNKVISIDLPSGMKSEFGNKNQKIIKAATTLTLEFPKLAMLLPETGEYCGNIKILSIGLSKDFITNASSSYHYITDQFIKDITLKREKFAHKGTYGHALLICGSKEMIGAAILATGAALRSGCGLVTTHIPEEERLAIQISYPSAILSLDRASYFSTLPTNLSKYTSIGIGCGLGQNHETAGVFKQLLNNVYKPIVIDADALNILSDNYNLRQHIPAGSILTPHPGELKRLIGEWQSEKEKIENVRKLASNLKSIIVVKGAHSMIYLPDGNCYFNSTGNSGMAKGGSGDVLTGLITGLIARGYNSTHAAILGVYAHGAAGDKAASVHGLEKMNSSDIINYIQ